MCRPGPGTCLANPQCLAGGAWTGQNAAVAPVCAARQGSVRRCWGRVLCQGQHMPQNWIEVQEGARRLATCGSNAIAHMLTGHALRTTATLHIMTFL